MQSAFLNLAEQIKESAGDRRIIYVPNPGNFGDGLIRCGTKQFFHEHSIDHLEINIGFKRGRLMLTPFLLETAMKDNFFFIYGGGGAWHSAYDFGEKIVGFVKNFTSNYLVLPSTYEKTPKNFGGVLFRRDNYHSKQAIPHSHFCHDMAFYLTISQARRFPDAKREIGFLLRTDLESASEAHKHFLDNRDISRLGNHMSPGEIFLDLIAEYETILTDRLHVAVASCIVGRRVHMIAGSYFKNRAIYKSSIEGNFRDITFHESLDSIPEAIGGAKQI